MFGKSHYPDIWWDTTNKEHYILWVDVKQWVSAWSLSLLNKLLLVCRALTGDGQEDFSMSAQSASKEQMGISFKWWQQDCDDNTVCYFTLNVQHQINCECMWACVLSQLGAQSICWVLQLDSECCGGDRSLWRCEPNSFWLPVVWPACPTCPFLFPATGGEARSSLKIQDGLAILLSKLSSSLWQSSRIVKRCHRQWPSQNVPLIQNLRFLLQSWWVYFWHRLYMFQQ